MRGVGRPGGEAGGRAAALAGHGRSLAPEGALVTLSTAFGRVREDWQLGGGGPIRDRWLTRGDGLGQRCEARLENETVSGTFADLGPDGALRLALVGGGRRYISAGDVFFPDRG